MWNASCSFTSETIRSRPREPLPTSAVLLTSPATPMEQVCIPVPMPEEGETLELEVTVGGRTHLMQYRIETVRWAPDDSADERFDRLQQFVQTYDDAWDLVQIGSPGRNRVPITFRQRRTTQATEDEGA